MIYLESMTMWFSESHTYSVFQDSSVGWALDPQSSSDQIDPTEGSFFAAGKSFISILTTLSILYCIIVKNSIEIKIPMFETGFSYQFTYSAICLLHFFTFSLQIKIKMRKMYTIFYIYFENIQFYFTEFNMAQKLKCTNKVGVTS